MTVSNGPRDDEMKALLASDGAARPLLWRRVGVSGLLGTASLAALLVAAVNAGSTLHPNREEKRRVALLTLRLLTSLSGAVTVYAWWRSLASDGAALAHGSARWGGASSIPAVRSLSVEPWALLDPAFRLPPGTFLLGRGEDDAPLVLTGHLVRQHGVIIGASGTGKTRGFMLPNAAFQEGMSLLCTDPKSELWRYTSGRYATPRRYAPVEPDASCCFNWIPLCADPRFAELCARTLIEAGEEPGRRAEAIWIEAETAFLAALFAHSATLPEPTPLTAYRLFTRQTQAALLAQLAVSSSEVAQEQCFIFQQTQERMRGTIVPAVAAKLQFLRDPRIARFTSASQTPPDLGSLRYTPGAVYWCVPEQDVVRLRPLSSLFFALALDQITRAISEEDPAAVTVLALLDEIANIGPLPHFDTTVALARSRGISLWLGLQSLSQLEDRYGRPAARTILANCATRISLAGLDPDSAEYVSRLLGQATVTLSRPSWSLKHFLGRTTGVSYSRSTAPRPLLTPDEVRRLGSDEALVVLFNYSPLRIRKFWYSLSPSVAFQEELGPARSLTPLNELSESGAVGTHEPPPVPKELLLESNMEEKHPRSTVAGRGFKKKSARIFRVQQRHSDG